MTARPPLTRPESMGDDDAHLLVAARDLSKRWGAHRAVDGVSLEVFDHEVMGLLGPNGSGKSTILRILAGYLRPSAGSASIAGQCSATM